MNQKWYISTLIILLTLIGVVCEQQVSVPNQEIVLQFADAGVTTQDTQETLETVKKQLQDLGVENIQVKQQESGSIKITYYSEEDVSVIQQTLSKENNLALDYSPIDQDNKGAPLPSSENKIAFNLDVHEIQKGHDVNWGLNGTLIPDLEHKSNPFFNSYASFDDTAIGNDGGIVRVAYKVNRNIALAIHNVPHTIPEVRAGPVC